MQGKLTVNRNYIDKYIVLLFLLIVQFSAAWVYPPSSFNGVNTLVTEKTLGVPFQYMLWLAILIVFLVQFSRGFIQFYVSILSPYVLFVLVGFISSISGIMPFDSLKLLSLFVLMLLSGVACAVAIPVRRLGHIVYYLFALLVFISVLISLIYPPVGAQYYGSNLVWRGVFTNKNQFGWFLSISLIIFVVFYKALRPWLSLGLITLTVVALVMSGSKGSLVASVLALFFLYFISILSRYISSSLFFLVIVCVVFFAMFFGYFFLTDFLIFIGRDPTLTGRTVVWGMYLNAMLHNPVLGSGPGSFTSFSEMTLPIAIRLNELGAIFTPHNAYLGVFGDAGVLGFLAFVGFLFYFAFFQYFKFRNIYSLACSGLSILFLIDGFVETHEIFSPGLLVFITVLFRSMAVLSECTKESTCVQ